MYSKMTISDPTGPYWCVESHMSYLFLLPHMDIWVYIIVFCVIDVQYDLVSISLTPTMERKDMVSICIFSMVWCVLSIMSHALSAWLVLPTIPILTIFCTLCYLFKDFSCFIWHIILSASKTYCCCCTCTRRNIIMHKMIVIEKLGNTNLQNIALCIKCYQYHYVHHFSLKYILLIINVSLRYGCPCRADWHYGLILIASHSKQSYRIW